MDITDKQICNSLCDLMEEAYQLSLKVGHSELAPDGSYFTWRELPTNEENNDMVSAWADGLTHKYYQDRVNGHCSLQTTIDFDVGDFESKVKMNIECMKAILARVGPPRQLTFEEMRARGYRGSWIGEA